MGTTNFGVQTISFDFQEPGKSENFNKLNHKILEPGIYEGGLLSYADATHINLAPFLAYIEDTDTEVSVRVETAEVVNLLVASSAPYCILRFNWSNTTNNYADVLMTSYANIEADDLIIGRAIYDVTTLETFFDYSRKSVPVITTDIAEKSEFIVRPQEPYDKTVSIQGGILNNGVESITVPSGSSPTISDTTLGRTDIVYILPSGSFAVIEGEDSASPITPDYGTGYALCEIHRGAGKTYITGADITMVSEDKFAMDNLLRADVENKVATQKTTTIPKNITQAYENLIKNGNNLTLSGWTDSDSSRQLSDQSINGSYFTKVVNSAVAWAGYATQALYETFTSSILSGSVTIREGSTTGNLARFGFFNITAGAFACQIDIDFNTSSVVATTGNLLKTEWYDEETVKVYFQTITLPNLTDDLKVTCYASPSAPSQEYTYFTEVQLLDDSTSALFPFVDGSKEADVIEEVFSMPDKFTFDMIIEPKFSYDTNLNQRLWGYYIDATHYFRVIYVETLDYFEIQWLDDGTKRVLASQNFDTGSSLTDINQRIRIVGSLDLISGDVSGSRFIVIPLVYGAINEDSSWGSAPDVKASNFSTLLIGHEGGSQADSEYEYLRIYDGLLEGTVTESSDVDVILKNQNLLFDASIDEFKETKIEAGTPVAVALEGIVQDVKTGVAIQDNAILNRHLDPEVFDSPTINSPTINSPTINSPTINSLYANGLLFSPVPTGLVKGGELAGIGLQYHTTRVIGLDDSHIALIRTSSVEPTLRTYQYDFITQTWSQIGNIYTLATVGNRRFRMDKFGSNRVVIVDPTTENMFVMSWDGADWTPVGNAYSLGSIGISNDICSLGTNDDQVAFVNADTGNLQTYSWDDTDFTPIGSAYATGSNTSTYMGRMTPNRVIFRGLSDHTFAVLDWDGSTTWTLVHATVDPTGAGGSMAITRVDDKTFWFSRNTGLTIELWNIENTRCVVSVPRVSLDFTVTNDLQGASFVSMTDNTYAFISEHILDLTFFEAPQQLAYRPHMLQPWA